MSTKGIVLCTKGNDKGVTGTLEPYANLFTNRKSPTSKVFSIEPVGI